MNYFNLNRKVLAVLLVLLAGACKPEQRAGDEARAAYAGSWTIVKAVRNLDDITSGCDFGRSLITLNADGTYTVDKTAMFIVTKNGDWAVRKQSAGDIIVLKPSAGGPAPAYEMQSDTTGNAGNIIANFTTGSSNTYEYILKKIVLKEKSKP
jgi:hypothetical protein